MVPTVSLDPLLGLGGSAIGALFDALTAVSPVSHTVVPGLARSWRRVSDTEAEFTIDPSATFSDGSPVGSADVVFSLGSLLGGGSPLAALLAPLVRVGAPSPSVARVVTGRPDPLLTRRLSAAPIVSEAAYLAAKPGQVAPLLGSGPYVANAFQPGAYLELVPSPHPWRAAPALSSLTLVTWATQGGLLAALSSGQLELAEDLPAAAGGELAGRCTVELAPIGRVASLRLDTTVPPFSDARVRRALAAALDVPALVAGALGGVGAPLDGQLAIPGCTGYVAGLAPAVPDAGAARRLLAAAGHRDGVTTVLAGPASQAALLEAIAAQLAAVGITAAPVRLSTSAWSSELAAGTGHPLLYAETDLAPLFDAGPAYACLASPGRAGRPLGGTALAALSAAQAVELDEGRRAGLLRDLALGTRAELPLVPLFSRGWYYGFWPQVSGVTVLGPGLVLSGVRSSGTSAG
jgi:peptide/nickel transport system substrate-binding protein